MTSEIRELFAFNHWANLRMLDAAAALPDSALRQDMNSSFTSVLGTLTHIAQSEWIWLERWNGHSPSAPPPWTVHTLDDLRTAWSTVTAAQTAFVSALSDADLGRVIEYRNLRGDPLANPLWQLLRHVVNHGTYHRGQVVTMLRQLGHAAPSTDLVLYFREQAARAQPAG